jgi:hypothetical protein
MFRTNIDHRVFSEPSWWHWAATVPLLVAHVIGVRGALAAAMLLCAAFALTFWLKLCSVHAMPVQVRLVYLAILAVGLLPYMAWLHWVQIAGTSAVVSFGYCPLVRMLTLLPPNRAEPLTRSYLTRLAVAPANGGLWLWPAESQPKASGCSCSLDRRPSRADDSMRPAALG